MEGRGELTWCGQCQAVELWPENIPSVLFYLSCETQWRYAGMSNVPTGLDYAGVRAGMALQAIPAADRPGLFEDLQVLERAYLEVSNARLAKENEKAKAKTPNRPARPGR